MNEAGTLHLAAALTWSTINVVHESACPEIGPICAERDEPPHLHDLTLQLAELRLFAEAALSRTFAFEVQLPVRVTGATFQYRRLDGTPFVPDYPSIHHRTETLLGVGDPWLLTRGTLPLGGFVLSARLGVTLPLGSTEENPFAAGERGEPHQHLQFGTGTFNPLTGVEVSRALGPVTLLAQGQAVWMAYQNSKGYRAGHRVTASVRADVALGAFRPALGLDLLHEEPERWDGVVQQDGNLGRTDFLVSVGLTWSVSHSTHVTLLARIPFARRVLFGDEHDQLTYPFVLTLSVASSLSP